MQRARIDESHIHMLTLSPRPRPVVLRPRPLRGRRPSTGRAVWCGKAKHRRRSTGGHRTMATIEPSGRTEGLFAGAAGAWVLDPSATTIELQTKAMWGLAKVKGSFTAVDGAGTVTADGGVSGTLVIDASSVNTSNSKRDT